MNDESRIARTGQSLAGHFLLVCLVVSALLTGVSSGAQEKPPGTAQATAPQGSSAEPPAQQSSPTAARTGQGAVAATSAASQVTVPAEVLAQKKKAALNSAQRAVRPGDEGAAIFREDNPGQRERWFYEQRAYPLGYIPFGIRHRAVEARRALREQERRQGIGSFAPRARTVAPPPAPAAAAGPVFPQTILASTTEWTFIGPQPVTSSSSTVKQVSGRTSAIAVDPTDPDIVYVGGAQGGIWKSVNGGVTWAPMSDFTESLAIGAIAIENSAASCGISGPCQTIYVGTGEQTFSIGSYYGAGILKSTNGGVSWQNIPGPFGTVSSIATGGARISSLAIRPGTGGNTAEILAGVQILFSADSGASSGIYRSVDGGQTWAQVPSASGAVGTDVLFHPTDPNIAYAALGTPFLIGGAVDPQNGVYKSTNGGATWTPMNSGLPANRGRTRLAIAPSNPNVLFAAITDVNASSNHLAGVFRTGDGAANWARVAASNPLLGGSTSTVCSSQCWYDLVIRVHPNNENVAYIGGAAQGGYFLRTIDSGTNWIAMSSDGVDRLHVDIHAIAFGISGGTVRMWNGNDGGVWSADVSNPTAAAIDWVNHNGPPGGATTALGTLQYYPGHSIHPGNPDFTIGGTQDNGTHLYNGTLGWQDAAVCGDGGYTAIDPDVPTTVYATCQNIDINKSLDGGSSFLGFQQGTETGLSNTDRGAFIPPLIIDTNANFAPFARRPLYFGTCRIWQGTSDPSVSSITWTAISPDLTGESTSSCQSSGFFEEVRAIAIAPYDSRVVYAGTSDGRIHRTLDASVGGLASWQNLTTADLPNRVVTSIAVDPHDPAKNTVYATFSGFTFGSDTKGHVFMTSNAGVSWTDISAGLPNTPVNDIVVDPDVPGALYAGTDVGVWMKDGGNPWVILDPDPNDSLPNVAVLGLKLHRPTRLLRAGTHGRGMWDLLLTNFNPTYSLASMTPTSANAGDPDTAITATGNGFSATSVIRFSGTNLVPTTFNPSTGELSATIPAAMLATGQTAQIDVFDSAQPPPGTTNGLPFSVTNPPPVLNMITPASAIPGDPAFTLTADGSDFVSSSVVRWNGSDRVTTFVSSTQLTAQIPATDIASPNINLVTVFNASPGGGTTAPQTFTVGTPPPNDDFANAIIINANPFMDAQNTAAGSEEAGEPLAPCAAVNGGIGNFHSIWYRFTPTSDVTVNVDTNGSNFDTVLSVWTGTAVGALQPVTNGCDDDGIAIGGASIIATLPLTANTTYHFMVGGFTPLPGFPNAGNAVFNFTIPPDFSVTTNPGAVTVTRGQASQAITVTATPLNGIAFSNAIAFSCTGLPSQSTCQFNPASVTPGAMAATASLTITTTAPGMAPPNGPQGVRWSPPPVAVLSLMLLALLLMSAALGARAARRAAAWQLGGCLLAVVILAGLSVSCGGGGGGGGAPAPPPPNPGTPTGTFQVMVRGTSGAIQKTATVTLTVQ